MKMLLKIVIVGFLINFLYAPDDLLAQQTIIDSLEKELQLHYQVADSNKVKLLLRLVDFEREINADRAWQTNLQAISASKNIDYKIGLGFAYNLAGLMLSYDVNHLVKANKYYDSAIAVFRQANDKRSFVGLGHAYNNKGLAANQLDNYKNSLEYYLKALSFYEKPGAEQFQIIAYNNLTNLYRSTQDPEKAFEYAEKAFGLTPKASNSNFVNCAYLNYAFALMGIGNYEKAESLIFQRQQIIEKNGYAYDLQYFNSHLGYLYYLQGKYGKADPYLAKGLQYAVKTKDHLSVCEALGFVIQNQIKKGELSTSKKNIERLSAIVKSVRSKYHELNMLDCNYHWHKKAGNFKEALMFSEKAGALRDSLLDSKNKIHMNYAVKKFQAEKTDQEITQLQKDIKIQELLIENRSVLIAVFIGITLLLLVFLLVLYFYFKNRQKIAEQDKQFMIMSSLIKGQEKERSRLAKDLHDGIGCILTSVKYSLTNVKRTIDPENTTYTKVFENSIDVIDTSIKELRRVAYNMMPEALIKFGLDEGLKDFCQFINNSNGLNIYYQSHGLNHRLNNDTEIVLYRIVQELLTNVVKHSAATETYVQLIKDGSRLNISVEDNGKGFDLKKLSTKKSTGWLSLQSRVNYLKGRLEVSSIMEKGTTVGIEFNV